MTIDDLLSPFTAEELGQTSEQTPEDAERAAADVARLYVQYETSRDSLTRRCLPAVLVKEEPT